MAADPLQLFGRRLRELRQERGWSQEQLAEFASVHENFVSRLETGAQEPGLIVILKLARAFDVPAAKLLSEFTGTVIAELRLR
jgi:XRE family transcriptional regulator, regulator of sulfur utilization